VTVAEALEVLALPARPEPGDLRRAYLRAVKEHPPERDPAGFQQVRGAFELLSRVLVPHLQVAPPPVRPSTDVAPDAGSTDEVRSSPGPVPDPLEALRARCDALVAERRIAELVSLLGEHAQDERARALALTAYAHLLGPYELGYLTAWALDDDGTEASQDARPALHTLLRGVPGNVEALRAIVERVAATDREVAVAFLLGLDRANATWARIDLLTRFADDLPAATLTGLVGSSSPYVLSQLHRIGMPASIGRELARLRAQQWRASRADALVRAPTMDDLATATLTALSAGAVPLAHELYAAGTESDDATRRSGQAVLQLHLAKALLELGDDFPQDVRTAMTRGILDGEPARHGDEIRDRIVALSDDDYERALKMRSSRALSQLYASFFNEAVRLRPSRDDVPRLQAFGALAGFALGWGTLFALQASRPYLSAFLAVACFVCFAPQLVAKRPGTDPRKKRIDLRPLVVAAAALLFWPLAFMAMDETSTLLERDALTQSIDDALAHPAANGSLAVLEFGRTEQGQRARRWMQATPTAAPGVTTAATLLRDWCIVGHLVEVDALCDRASELFPALDSPGPCPDSLRPFTATADELAAALRVEALAPYVEALRESTVGLLTERCGAP
jgi:hypothetical protein